MRHSARPDRRGFASDNYAGAHPEVLAAIAEANGGHQIAYGEDVYTARLQEVMAGALRRRASRRSRCSTAPARTCCRLQSMLPRWGAVVCAETAHIHTDENGAPERVGGLKLLTVPTPDGKLTPELIDRQAWGWGDEHRAQPLAVSITQTTELGTCYTPDEIRAIADHVARAGHARCTWTAPGSPTPRPPSTCRCAPSPPTPASTCCRSAAPRTACCSARRSSCCDPERRRRA